MESVVAPRLRGVAASASAAASARPLRTRSTTAATGFDMPTPSPSLLLLHTAPCMSAQQTAPMQTPAQAPSRRRERTGIRSHSKRPVLLALLSALLLALCTASTLPTAVATGRSASSHSASSTPSPPPPPSSLPSVFPPAGGSRALVTPAVPTPTDAVAKPRTLRLGFLGSTNLPNSNTQTGGAPALFAARLAVAHLNAQTSVLPDVSLELISNNTNSDAGTGNFMAYDQIQSRGVVGIVGEYLSGVSVTASYPSRFYRVPQVSYGSTSPDFTTFHSTLYPYFSRMCPSQNLESVLLAFLIKSQGWGRVGLVYTTDSAGVSGAREFQLAASKLGVQVVTTGAFLTGANIQDVYFVMDKLRQSDARILLFIGTITDFQSIITVCTEGIRASPSPSPSPPDGGGGVPPTEGDEDGGDEDVVVAAGDVGDSGGNAGHSGVYSGATNSSESGDDDGGGGGSVLLPPLGLYGPGFQWIALHSCMYTTLFTTESGEILQGPWSFAQGMLGLQNYAAVESELYRSYAASWAAQDPQPDLPSVVPTDPASMTLPAHFAYDAVWFLARAIDSMEREGVDLSRASMEQKARFQEVLLQQQFDGVTGRIVVDHNGDRFAPFDIVNFQGNDVVRVGTVGSEGSVAYDPDAAVQYMGGTKAPDAPVRTLVEIGSGVRAGLSAGTIVVTLLVLAGVGALLALRSQPVFKAASPPFVGAMLLGVLLLVSSMWARLNENEGGGSTGTCVADVFLANYGYTLIAGSLLLKTYRVDSIFRMRRFQQRVLTNLHLGLGLLALMLLQTALLLGLVLGDPLTLERSAFGSSTGSHAYEDYIHCGSTHQQSLYPAAIMSFRFALLVVTAIYAFRIRSIPDEFNESKQLGMTVYNLAFLSLLLPIIDAAMGRGKSLAVVAYGCSIFCIALCTAGIMLVPKIMLHAALVRAARAHHDARRGGGSGRAGANGGMKDTCNYTVDDSADEDATIDTNVVEAMQGQGRGGGGAPGGVGGVQVGVGVLESEMALRRVHPAGGSGGSGGNAPHLHGYPHTNGHGHGYMARTGAGGSGGSGGGGGGSGGGGSGGGLRGRQMTHLDLADRRSPVPSTRPPAKQHYSPHHQHVLLQQQQKEQQQQGSGGSGSGSGGGSRDATLHVPPTFFSSRATTGTGTSTNTSPAAAPPLPRAVVPARYQRASVMVAGEGAGPGAGVGTVALPAPALAGGSPAPHSPDALAYAHAHAQAQLQAPWPPASALPPPNEHELQLASAEQIALYRAHASLSQSQGQAPLLHALPPRMHVGPGVSHELLDMIAHQLHPDAPQAQATQQQQAAAHGQAHVLHVHATASSSPNGSQAPLHLQSYAHPHPQSHPHAHTGPLHHAHPHLHVEASRAHATHPHPHSQPAGTGPGAALLAASHLPSDAQCNGQVGVASPSLCVASPSGRPGTAAPGFTPVATPGTQADAAEGLSIPAACRRPSAPGSVSGGSAPASASASRLASGSGSTPAARDEFAAVAAAAIEPESIGVAVADVDADAAPQQQ